MGDVVDLQGDSEPTITYISDEDREKVYRKLERELQAFREGRYSAFAITMCGGVSDEVHWNLQAAEGSSGFALFYGIECLKQAHWETG